MLHAYNRRFDVTGTVGIFFGTKTEPKGQIIHDAVIKEETEPLLGPSWSELHGMFSPFVFV